MQRRRARSLSSPTTTKRAKSSAEPSVQPETATDTDKDNWNVQVAKVVTQVTHEWMPSVLSTLLLDYLRVDHLLIYGRYRYCNWNGWTCEEHNKLSTLRSLPDHYMPLRRLPDHTLLALNRQQSTLERVTHQGSMLVNLGQPCDYFIHPQTLHVTLVTPAIPDLSVIRSRASYFISTIPYDLATRTYQLTCPIKYGTIFMPRWMWMGLAPNGQSIFFVESLIKQRFPCKQFSFASGQSTTLFHVADLTSGTPSMICHQSDIILAFTTGWQRFLTTGGRQAANTSPPVCTESVRFCVYSLRDQKLATLEPIELPSYVYQHDLYKSTGSRVILVSSHMTGCLYVLVECRQTNCYVLYQYSEYSRTWTRLSQLPLPGLQELSVEPNFFP